MNETEGPHTCYDEGTSVLLRNRENKHLKHIVFLSHVVQHLFLQVNEMS